MEVDAWAVVSMWDNVVSFVYIYINTSSQSSVGKGGHLQLPVQPPEFLLNPTFKTFPRRAVSRVVLVKLSRSPQVAYEYHSLL